MQTLQILIPRLRKALAQLPYLPQTLSLVWTAARGWTVTWGVLLLLQAHLPFSYRWFFCRTAWDDGS
jgi:ATP-binding cassette subfamily B protein